MCHVSPACLPDHLYTIYIHGMRVRDTCEFMAWHGDGAPPIYWSSSNTKIGCKIIVVGDAVGQSGQSSLLKKNNGKTNCPSLPARRPTAHNYDYMHDVTQHQPGDNTVDWEITFIVSDAIHSTY